MCGIVGVFWYGGGEADRDLVARQAAALRHRGPDDGGLWCEGPAALGHRRLSIVDPSPGGHQPMANEDGTVVVVTNGELYNWPETAPALRAAGHRFRGTSDTEMLLHLWEDHGVAMLERLRGMFAFALFDRGRRTLLLARDRMGKKPLYWHDDGRRIAFASELKALLLDPSIPRDVEPGAIADALTFQYVPSPGTVWRGVRKLPPGSRLLCDAAGPRVEAYWTYPVETERGVAPGESVERVGALLEDAVRVRLMSDVPVGALLSGGVDSSAVTALMVRAGAADLKTFSIGFEGIDSADFDAARAVARHLGTDHHEWIVTPRELRELPRLAWALDEPYGDASIVPSNALARLASREVKTVLSGDGGDEAYGGYVTYLAAARRAWVERIPEALRRGAAAPAALLRPGSRLRRSLERAALDVGARHRRAMSRFGPEALASILSPGFRAETARHDPWRSAALAYDAARRRIGPLPALLALDATTYLTDDVLVKVDRVSMLHSLEVRSPLLDQRLIETAARLPIGVKLRGGVTKWVLREAVRPLLPPGVMARGKQGFSLPFRGAFGVELERIARDVLLDARCAGRGWLDPKAVAALARPDAPGGTGRRHQLFALVMLELWARAWLDRPREEIARPFEGDAIADPAPVPDPVAPAPRAA
ncbi:MAG: asparagine synthase (glutamine-hydrolyzing) [Hyphomicrobiales bacterium]